MSPFWPEGRAIVVDAEGDTPRRFRWEFADHAVRDLSIHWRVHTGWWTGRELWRDYWEVTTTTGLLCVIYRDLVEGGWFLERIYE